MASHIERRKFLATLGGAAAAWPLAARAQQPAMPVVGFLHTSTAAPFLDMVSAFRRGLNEAGLSFRVIGGCRHKHADASHARPLLRARRERPRRRAAERG